MTANEKAQEVLGSVRRLAAKDADALLNSYGSLKDIILAEDYKEFGEINGISDAKIESLTACFKRNIAID